jgi:hypothetical protein
LSNSSGLLKIYELTTSTIDLDNYIFLTKQGTNDANFQFVAKFIPENETTSVIGSHGSTQLSILPWTYRIVSLDFVLKTKMRKCNPTVTRLTPCVMKSYQEFFGNGFNQGNLLKSIDNKIFRK